MALIYCPIITGLSGRTGGVSQSEGPKYREKNRVNERRRDKEGIIHKEDEP